MNRFLLLAAAATIASVAAAQPGVRPGEPTELTTNVTFDGTKFIVSGSFKAPLMTGSFSDPQPLTELGRIEVTRTCYDVSELDEPIYEILNPTPGETYSFQDNTLTDFGYQYTYSVKAYSTGTGSEIVASFSADAYVFVGIKPDTPSFVKVETGENGFPPVTITMKAPEKTFDGQEFQSPMTELVLKNYITYGQEEVIETITNPEPGKEYVYVHQAENGKKYNYRLYASTAYGTSDFASHPIYIGEDYPTAPLNVVGALKDGGVELTWEAPAGGSNQGWLDPASVRYIVERADNGGTWAELARDIAECKYFDTCDDIKVQTEVSYRITSYNTIGEGGYEYSAYYIVGPANALPFVENFNAGTEYSKKPSNLWNKESDWDYSAYDYNMALTGIDGNSDNDEGFAYCYHRYSWGNDICRLASCDISLDGAKYPVLTYHYAAIPNLDNNLAVGYRPAEGEDVMLHSFGTSEGAPAEGYVWIKKIMPIENVEAKTINIVFVASTPADGEFENVFIDGIRLDDYPPVEVLDYNRNDGNATVTWTAPSNSTLTADAYDVYVNDAEPVRVTSPEYSFAIEPEGEYSVKVRAHYGDIPSCLSEALMFNGSGTMGIGSAAADSFTAVEYFDVSGRKVAAPAEGMFLIKRSTRADGSQVIEKTIYRK